jgi:hypothetical protein
VENFRSYLFDMSDRDRRPSQPRARAEEPECPPEQSAEAETAQRDRFARLRVMLGEIPPSSDEPAA